MSIGLHLCGQVLVGLVVVLQRLGWRLPVRQSWSSCKDLAGGLGTIQSNLHAYFAVVTTRGEHARVNRVPIDSVHAGFAALTLAMALQGLDQLLILFVPYVYPAICKCQRGVGSQM